MPDGSSVRNRWSTVFRVVLFFLVCPLLLILAGPLASKLHGQFSQVVLGSIATVATVIVTGQPGWQGVGHRHHTAGGCTPALLTVRCRVGVVALGEVAAVTLGDGQVGHLSDGVGSLACRWLVFVSPPPVTVAVLVTLAGALLATADRQRQVGALAPRATRRCTWP